MIFLYLKVAYRILIKNNVYSLISILGLSVAMSLTFILIGFILFQLSFNKYHKNHDQIYRAISINLDYDNSKEAGSPFILASALKNNFPEVNKVARLMNIPFTICHTKIKKEDDFIEEQEFYSADPEIFSILDIPLKSKSSDNVLTEKYSIVLSETMAHKYFGNDNPVGERLTTKICGRVYEFVITGIMFDFPKNSSIQADFFCSNDFCSTLFSKYYRDDSEFFESWEEQFFNTIILFNKKVKITNFQKKLNTSIKDLYEENSVQFQMQKLEDIYFYSSNIKNDYYFIKGNIQQVYLFAGFVLVILIIAVINYIILTTARSTLRYKEIGLKKVFGVTKTGLIAQLITESLLISFISFILSIIILFIIKNYTHLILFDEIDFIFLWSWKIIMIFLVITILTGIFSGLYISMQIAAFNPIDTIKNLISVNRNKFDIKVFLIIFQLSSFIILTVFSIVIFKQVRFAMNSDLGFTKEDLIVVRFDSQEFRGYEEFKNIIKQNPNVFSVSGAFIMPPSNASQTEKFARADDPSSEVSFEKYTVDYDFFKTMGIKILEGCDFNQENATDFESSIILNKKAITDFDIENPIGKKIGNRRIIGIADNFYTHSFHKQLRPAVFYYYTYSCIHIIVRTLPGKTEQVLYYLKDQWSIVAPHIPFNYFFIDNELKKLYRKDRQFGQSVNFYTLIAIFISILGLFGTSLYMSDRKSKEIVIRKVHGASSIDIVYMLTKQFLKYALIANVIAIPIAYYMVDNWIHNFAIRINLLNNWWVFILTGFLSIIIIISTIGYKSWQAASINLVDKLKCE